MYARHEKVCLDDFVLKTSKKRHICVCRDS
jgi:hypothetical protein